MKIQCCTPSVHICAPSVDELYFPSSLRLPSRLRAFAVARARRALGYDVPPARKDISNVDARKLPPELTGKVDFVFIDPPYGTPLDYGPDPRDIGKLDAAGPAYYPAMEQVFAEIHR